jgi:hypothetical protein
MIPRLAVLKSVNTKRTSSLVTPDDKTRFSAGSGLRLETLLDAENRSPAFDGFIFACFPTDKLRGNLDSRFQIEAQGSFVIENDFDNVVIGRD